MWKGQPRNPHNFVLNQNWTTYTYRQNDTYYLSQQDHILPSNYEYSSRDVTKFLSHVDALNCLVEN